MSIIRANDPKLEEVALYAVGLNGVTRITCPWCGGGTSKEKSLGITSDGGRNFRFRCFRAGCGVSGGKGFPLASVPKRVREFTSPTRTLEPKERDFLSEKYLIQAPNDWLYSDPVERVVIPVCGPVGERRGIVARSFTGGSPKADVYRTGIEGPLMGWFRPGLMQERHRVIVVVEDALSAQRVRQQGAIGIALLGSYLSLDMVLEIVQHARGRQVVLALDKDAFAKSLKFLNEFKFMFDPVLMVARLERDLKDDSDESLKEFLGAFDNGRNKYATLGAAAPERNAG